MQFMPSAISGIKQPMRTGIRLTHQFAPTCNLAPAGRRATR